MVRTLLEWRRARLQTIRELAAKAGVSTRTVLRVEHGEQIPHPGIIKKLSAALDVEPTQVREFRVAMALPEEEGES